MPVVGAVPCIGATRGEPGPVADLAGEPVQRQPDAASYTAEVPRHTLGIVHTTTSRPATTRGY